MDAILNFVASVVNLATSVTALVVAIIAMKALRKGD